MARVLVETDCVTKVFQNGHLCVEALRGVSVHICQGEFVAIMGPSGSGKSTLMHIIGCLDRPTSGVCRFGGRDVSNLSDKQLSRIRSNEIGFVFQTFNLIHGFNVLENVRLPFLYRDDEEASVNRRAVSAIEKVGLADRIQHRPSELSGGELQRVSIARAIAIDPTIVLADEPTGNLDLSTGKDIMALFLELNAQGMTVILVTHDRDLAACAERIIRIRDGMIEPD
ncbi:MAG: ABC transporter ATP-binding protein [Candidatus Abyssobacteria bacterium SURF_17]|jgi:putative ABC transport system ATP-binding protein|uniref:ABC transporter ATP-binding protein n=1 Tax=Candidatus Abyssobacteria bacterium SURF_17 TaxID=2093361 RepID=A0A419F176_9BACT|nr:MAG: ABC transporter ATP-binding protein [Candidatus Abyssubacteria bacterium SURF_17]